MNKEILFFLGAGISHESGIPTFRSDKDSLWNNHDVNTICNIKNFYKNKELIFSFYNQLKLNYSSKIPNKAHNLIAHIQKEFPNNTSVYTTNIDLLLEKAGCTNVIHLHGSLNLMNCTHCHFSWNINQDEFLTNITCPNCKRYKFTKPGIIFFGEKAPQYSYFYQHFTNNSHALKIVIGSSLKVIDENMINPNINHSILIDPNPTSFNFTHIIKKNACDSIPEITQAIEYYLTH